MNSKVKANELSAPTSDKNMIKDAIVRHLHCSLGTDENKANNHAWWKATCATAQEYVLEQLRKTQKSHYLNDTRAVHYFSAEFLMGRLMSNNLHNLGLFEKTDLALKELGVNPWDIMLMQDLETIKGEHYELSFFAKAEVEEIIFKSEECAKEFLSYIRAIRNIEFMRDTLDKAPSSMFMEKNKIYFIRMRKKSMINFNISIQNKMKN
jgi:hypothetical protein